MRYVNVLCRDGLRRTIAKTTATKMTPAHLSALADTYAMQAGGSALARVVDRVWLSRRACKLVEFCENA